MGKTYTVEELEKCSKEELMRMLLSMQERMNGNLENLIEQIRVASQQKFGRHTEKLEAMEGQLSFFNEAEYLSEEALGEEPKDILPKKPHNKKQKGKREADLKDFPEEPHDHDIPQEELDSLFGKGYRREMPTEEYRRLRYKPAFWMVEKHNVHVYAGTDGDHQDEFLRGDRPRDLLRNSILTPSLGAAIMNAK